MKTDRAELEGLEWYARNPAHALDGMVDMTPEQCGIYNRTIDRIYLTGDRLRENDHLEAAINKCDIRVYRRVKAYLIEQGKIRLEDVDGRRFIRNDACTREVIKGRSIVLAKAIAGAEGGKASARSREQSSNQNNGRGQARASAPAQPNAQHLNQYKNNNLTETPSSVPPREGSAAQPTGPASPSLEAIAQSEHAQVRAFAASLDPDDQKKWAAYQPAITREAGAWLITCPTGVLAGLLHEAFRAKLRASLKTGTITGPNKVGKPTTYTLEGG